MEEKMFKKLIGFTVFAVLAGLAVWSTIFLSGCAKKEIADSGKAELVFAMNGAETNYVKIITEQYKKFEKLHPDIKIKFEPVSGQVYTQKLLTRIASGSAPDVFFLDAPQLPEFISKGTLLPFDELI